MSKGLDAATTRIPTSAEHHPQARPNWNVNNHEQLAQIRHERAPQVQQQRHDGHQQPAMRDNHRNNNQPVDVRQSGGHNRADVTNATQVSHQRIDNRRDYHPHTTEINRTVVNNRRDYHPQTTEINRTVVNNRYDYGNNGNQYQNNNNLRYLYGGLAGGAALGAGASYLYQNRDYGANYNGSNGRTGGYDNWANTSSTYNNYNNYNNYSNYRDYSNYNVADQYNNYNLADRFNSYNNTDRYGTYISSGYDRYDNYADDSDYSNYGSSYGDSYGSYASSNYGDTTYGGSYYDNGGIVSRPIFATTTVDNYGPSYGYERQNPMNVIPQLFGNIIGSVLGNITRSNHQRRYYDC